MKQPFVREHEPQALQSFKLLNNRIDKTGQDSVNECFQHEDVTVSPFSISLICH